MFGDRDLKRIFHRKDAAGEPEAGQELSTVNPIVFVMQRPVKTLMLVVAIGSGGVVGLSKMRGDILPPLNTIFPPLNGPKIYASLDSIGMRAQQMKEYINGRIEGYF